MRNDEMDGVKSIFQSKTFWGAFIAIAAVALGWLGLDFLPEDQVALQEALVGIAGVAGGVWAIIGRILASKTIT